MAKFANFMEDRTLDEVLTSVDLLKHDPTFDGLVTAFLEGDYTTILHGSEAQSLFEQFVKRLQASSLKDRQQVPWHSNEVAQTQAATAFVVGLASFDAFLQANVTGPPLTVTSILFSQDLTALDLRTSREQCLRSLDKDGLSVYQHIPHVELYCFARAIFLEYFPVIAGGSILESRWMRIRINMYHQRLLSSGMSNARLSDSAAGLQEEIEKDLVQLEKEVLGTSSKFTTEAKVQFVLEKAQIYIMQGLDLKARESVKGAGDVSGFTYALSGALGKRTRFQQTDISQLVVFAKSKGDGVMSSGEEEKLGKEVESIDLLDEEVINTGPTALDLNDDTLLEAIDFAKVGSDSDLKKDVPAALQDLRPNEQPQLKSLDQIILLTEATMKDEFAPLDKLNSEEILPYAVRVLSDKPTNWQIYTQALLVRSRIEAHRSRTQERSVLQLQAIVDQIIADTQEDTPSGDNGGIPQIQVTQFLPRAKASETAPVIERLKFVHQLNSPTRWEIETELAYAWSKAGSFLSALEIFKRLKLWPEVALCYHSVEQVEKATQIVRRQLYFSSQGSEMDHFDIDANEVVAEKWDGEIRTPSPPHAPRLWCILGDLEQDPTCWERAWEISNKRYARAQRTLGEYYSRRGEFEKARDAYMKATVVNRQNDEAWSRLGDIDLKVGNWDGAVIAFQQSIMIDDTDSKTYSNLGSALLSKYLEMMELQKIQAATAQGKVEELDEDDEDFQTGPVDVLPKDVLRQALTAYKRGATIAYDNWKIWDNVITIAGRMSPPSYPEILMAMRAVIRIRSPTIGEDAVDIGILRALVGEVTSRERTQNAATDSSSMIYVPPRGSLARAVIEMVNNEIVPLITSRAGLWFLVEKLSLYKRDYAAALSSAEKAWRITTSGEEWLEDNELWKMAAEATDGLVSAFENYGPMEGGDGKEVESGWKGKARSAIRSILGKARDSWGETDEYEMLKNRLEDLKSA